ncbi:MAG TPA: glycoside hydrolase family 97 catalytic domain-containing protein [Candidatus Cryptobacteroides pullicola]|nr:glycoside hydrolase family 97 catalytic domain-containing protein [Candidatus Cryptobacteroides pullicola]
MFHSLSMLLAAALTVLGSPDGKLSVRLEQTPDSRILYSVEYDGKTMLSPSPLGLVAQDCDYSKLVYTGEERKAVKVDYRLDRIKTSHVSHDAVRYMTHFKTPEGRLLDIEWHLSDNDVAFRYSIPRDTDTGSIRVMREETCFDFPEGTTTYLCPQSDAMIGWKRTKPSYEEYYRNAASLGEKSEFGHGFTFPCLFNTPGGWVLVSETGVDSRYCGSRLDDYAEGSGYRVAFPMPEENNGNGTVEPAFALPGCTPWRTITVGTDLAPIVETTIAFDVVEPRFESTRSYEFGKSTWSWIVWQDASCNYDDQKTYIDFASELGYPYCLIDAFWDQNIGRDRIEELSRYARSKGVSLFLWYASSGWWNDISQSPVHIMSDPIARKKEMRWLESIGVKGIKVDFFGGDKQETMRIYESILSDADDCGIMVIFHGCTLPRGWERMYPNYVGSEAVRASENLVFSQYECDIEAVNATLHPFIRNSVGCMEFGGTFLNKRLNRANGQPDARGRIGGTERKTSDAFQLATAVLFQNPIQNFALTPNNLEDAPAAAIEFMREVPTTWDETRYIAGTPSKDAVIARRCGSIWYVGAVNAVDETLELDVDGIVAALGGSSAEAIYTDEGQLVTAEGRFKKPIKVARNDGAVLIIR